MLEIIVLIWLSIEIGKMAKNKGLKPSTWQIYFVAGWILAEIIGVMIGFMIFGLNNLLSVYIVGIAFAFTSYFSIHSILNKFPDQDNEDINNIGKP